MLQPMLQQKPTFLPMFIEVFARDVAMPVAIRKALSDPPRIVDSWPRWGVRCCTPATPALGVAQGQFFLPEGVKLQDGNTST